ncbi:MAG TPA: tyrosine-type recombinase/integrase [Gaiellaceae bacterium]|nr:tyrosine-type recombinase/integrase [Gaiellaceae bacterium]
MRLDRAIDRYLGDLARQGKSNRTLKTYAFRLMPLCGAKEVAEVRDVRAVTTNECRAYLDNWRDAAPGTRYHAWAVMSGFFKWLYRAEEIDINPMARIEPPRRLPPEELDVVTVTGADVRKMFDVCQTWGELLCLSTLAYLGPRRGGASQLRWRDVDLERGTLRLREKGGKRRHLPIPSEFLALLKAAKLSGKVDCASNDYVIPMQRKQKHGRARDDRVISRYVKNIGERAGVHVRPHALRAAFAVQFLETHPGELEALQRLLGHRKPETTQIYLRRYNDQKAMENVRDLSWGNRFSASAGEAPSGVEPL